MNLKLIESSSRRHEGGTSTQPKTNKATDRQAAQRIEDFMLDPGPIPFRHETVSQAQRYMADRLREFEVRFNGGAKINTTRT